MHQLSLPGDPEQWGVDPSYTMTHNAEAVAKVKGIARGKKYNLMAQVIPIYGFGVLLYILYIIYKLTCKGKNAKSANYTTRTKANVENRISDYELALLHERLLQTERMMESIVSGKGRSSTGGRRRKSKTTPSKKEEKLLRQLRQITLLMQEGRLEGASPEMEAEQVPYGADWEGYPDETYPVYDDPIPRRRLNPIMLEEPPSQPTAEALAERMEQEEEEIMARKLSIVKEEDEEEEEAEDADAEKEEEEEEEEEDEDDNGEAEEEDDEYKEEAVEAAEEAMVEEEEEEEEDERRQLLSLPSPRPDAERQPQRLGLEVCKELQSQYGGKKQISFSEHKDVFRYPKEDTFEEEDEEEEEEEEEEMADEVEEEEEGTEVEEEEEEAEDDDDDDPVMEAESLQFTSEGCPNPEEEAEEDKEECLLMLPSSEDDGRFHADMPKEVSGLRMRNRRET